jgi:hypothetical protein
MIVARSDRSGAQPSAARALFASATKIERSPARRGASRTELRDGDTSNHVDQLPHRGAVVVTEIDRDGLAVVEQVA